MSDYPLNLTYDSNSPTGMYIPADVEDCIRELNKVLPAALLEKIRTSEEHDLAFFHFGLGMWMQNNWGLWMYESRLRRYFVELGISEPDGCVYYGETKPPENLILNLDVIAAARAAIRGQEAIPGVLGVFGLAGQFSLQGANFQGSAGLRRATRELLRNQID
jgi:hypothetical protein